MKFIEALSTKEQTRMQYWNKRDYFIDLRLKWRANMARHLFHMLPGESVLDIGSGDGRWTRALSAANGHSNPICAATFDSGYHAQLQSEGASDNIKPVLLDAFPGILEGRKFDTIVAWHMLPKEGYSQFLTEARKLLKPGGQFLLFEPNPWNPYNQLRRWATKIFTFGQIKEERPRFNRIEMLSILSEIGFTAIKILPYDFLFPPIPKSWVWPMQNLSLIFENMPYFRNFAGELYLCGRNPAPENWVRPKVGLAWHEMFQHRLSVVVPCHNEESIW